jgi:hypothetical protein
MYRRDTLPNGEWTHQYAIMKPKQNRNLPKKGEVLAKLGGEVCVIEQELVEMTRDARESNEERQLRNRVAGAYTSLWNVQCF